MDDPTASAPHSAAAVKNAGVIVLKKNEELLDETSRLLHSLDERGTYHV